jgi:hypothetical protein
VKPSKLIALFVIFPLLLILLWHTGRLLGRSIAVEKTWPRVEVQVINASNKDTALIQFLWKSEIVIHPIPRRNVFENATQGQRLLLYVDPTNFDNMRPATFSELWRRIIVQTAVALLLAGLTGILVRVYK